MGQTLATTAAAAALAPSRRASRQVLLYGFLAGVAMELWAAQFPFEQRPFILALYGAIFTFLTVKLFTSVSRWWRYLLIGEIWLSVLLIIAGITTGVLQVTVSAMVVAPVVALAIATWNWGLEVITNLRHKGHSHWFLIIVLLNAAIACVLALCIALTLKLIDYDNPADMVSPALHWLPRVLLALIIAKVIAWTLLAKFHSSYEEISEWLTLTARVFVAYIVPFFAVLFVLGMRPRGGHWPAFVGLVVSLMVTAYNSINTHRGPLDPALATATPTPSTPAPPSEPPAHNAEPETSLQAIARQANSYNQALKAAEDHQLQLHQAIRNAHKDGHSRNKIAKAAKMKRDEVSRIADEP